MYVLRGNNVDADYDGLKGKKVAVVCRPLVGLTYRDSGVAKQIGQQVCVLLKKNVSKIQIVDPEKIAEWVDEHSWEEYLDVGKALKADFVVGVDLEHFSIYEGQTVYQGKSKVAIKVYDCKTGKLAFEKSMPKLVYPPNHVISTSDVEESEFRQEYVGILAEHVARYFYPHDANADLGMDSMALR
jgi:hypothetical protein